MLGLETGADAAREDREDPGRGLSEGATAPWVVARQAGAGPRSSIPWPSGVFTDTHVPLGTSLKAFFW
jgi:hypothetical protein